LTPPRNPKKIPKSKDPQGYSEKIKPCGTKGHKNDGCL